jgi:hypothetical protein
VEDIKKNEKLGASKIST